MRNSHSNWLREHIVANIERSGIPDSAENIITLGSSLYPPKNPGAVALDLVAHAAEVIGNVDSYVAEKQARAEALAAQAIEKIKIADDRVRSAELARREAEADIQKFKETTEAFSDRIQELEKAMELASSRMSDAEAQLSVAEQRAKNGEMRANAAESAVKGIEEAIRVQILHKLPSAPRERR